MTGRDRAVMPADVVLVSMPFGELFSPSMGLSLLKGALNRDGVTSVVRYFGLPFARRIGSRLYNALSGDARPSARQLAGEWLFSRALFDITAADDDRYVDEVLRGRAGWITNDGLPLHPATIRSLLAARRHVDAFLDECADGVLAAGPRLVGFTSVFQQHLASLALARRLKQRSPQIAIVFGGSNCEGVMGAETIRQFPFVDAVVSGEADLVFPALVARAVAGMPLGGLEGVKTRDIARREFLLGAFQNAPSVRDLDALPYPDFDDFFAEFRATGFRRAWQPRIFFETSRGCWWGEKKHCTFCGLNGQTMQFRSKSAARALAELTWLVERHPGCDVQVVDNILDMRYFSDLLPELAERKLGVELFYETKANLKKEQVRLLRAAGVTEIQPGIESFSDRILELMRKGISGLQNVQLLKWCTELGVRPYWNLLWGFPGEPPEDYTRMAAVTPLLTHLVPPVGFGGLRLDRFSPNFFDAQRLGLRDVRPLPAYSHVYRVPDAALANLAYHFTFAYGDDRRVDEYVAPLLRELRTWRAIEGESALFFVDLLDALIVCDTRPCAPSVITVLAGVERELYLQCDAVCDVRRLADVARLADRGADEESVAARLEPLLESGLLLREGRRWLALAVPIGTYSAPARATARFIAAVRGIGHEECGEIVVPLITIAGTPLRRAPADTTRGAARADPGVPVRLGPEHFALHGNHALMVRVPMGSVRFQEGVADGEEGSEPARPEAARPAAGAAAGTATTGAAAGTGTAGRTAEQEEACPEGILR